MRREGTPRIVWPKLRITLPAKRIWVILGGLGGLVAIGAWWWNCWDWGPIGLNRGHRTPPRLPA